jgi:hypothetical protein
VCTHMPPHVLWYRTLPPSQGVLRGYHTSSDSGFCLPDRKGSDAAKCIVAPDTLGGLRCASFLRLWILPPYGEGSGLPRVLRFLVGYRAQT